MAGLKDKDSYVRTRADEVLEERILSFDPITEAWYGVARQN
jgi:hypothetical protein